jgi:lipopolysaccharide export system protein LptA
VTARARTPLLMAASVAAAVGAMVGGDAIAQTATGVPNALQGFSQNRDKPLKIDAESLEVRQRDSAGTFSGNVRVVQGDTNLRSNSLVVFYDQTGQGAKVTQAGASQRIRRLEAKGNVIVTQKEQTARGDTAIYDMPSNTITLQGNVVLTQCSNVMRGEKLIVNLTTGVSRVERGGSSSVQMLLNPSGGTPGSGAGCENQKALPNRELNPIPGLGRQGRAN